MSKQIEEGILGNEIWLGHNNGEVDTLLCTQKGWLQHVRINTPVIPYAMCHVDGYIWVGDDTGQLHVYLGTNFGCVGNYNLQKDQAKDSQIVDLIYLEHLKEFAVAMHCGKIFFVSNSFVKTQIMELIQASGDNIKTYSLSAVPKRRRITELWAGRSFGKLSVYTLKDKNVIERTELEHASNETESKNLFATFTISAENCVLTYTYPGCIVYQWDVETKQIVNKLDMSKLVPCSESMKSISIEENLTSEKCQVTAIETSMNYLYIGTAWGCIVIAECNSLRPITVFRPFEGKVSQMLCFRTSEKKKLVMATVGQGYRSLISRYTDYPCDFLLDEEVRHSMYTLLWHCEHWLAG